MILKKQLKHTPFVKICGLTDPETALQCAESGVDAIGLVFFEKSPRFVTDEQAKAICNALPGHIVTIGVFVDKSYEYIAKKIDILSLKAVQLHGNEDPGLIKRLLNHKVVIIKALFAARAPYIKDANLYKDAHYFLIEYGKGVLPGGNAEKWNYELLKNQDFSKPFFLAGGLDSDNIKDAVCLAKPFAVDVSSGVEKSPGIKDLKKMKNFLKTVQSI